MMAIFSEYMMLICLKACLQPRAQHEPLSFLPTLEPDDIFDPFDSSSWRSKTTKESLESLAQSYSEYRMNPLNRRSSCRYFVIGSPSKFLPT
jgi:hypothetical protein